MNNPRPHLKKRIPEFAFRAIVRDSKRLPIFDGTIAGNFIPVEETDVLHTVLVDESVAFIQVSPNGRHMWHNKPTSLVKVLVHPDTKAKVTKNSRPILEKFAPTLLQHLDQISV